MRNSNEGQLAASTYSTNSGNTAAASNAKNSSCEEDIVRVTGLSIYVMQSTFSVGHVHVL